MSAAKATPQTNPFPGLRPFREDEEHLFFGRENQVDAMVNKLSVTRFLAVVGTSGSGKSSLVNCGLRPVLRQGLMARAGTAWRMAQFRPGTDPIGAMARALAKDGVLFREYATAGLSLTEIIETSLRMSKLGLIDIVEQAALNEGVNLLVMVDQFEELFRYRQLQAAGRGNDQGIVAEAAAFVNLLLEVKEQATCPIYVVLTIRSDFLGDCTHFPGLAEAINAGQYLVPRMTRDERRAAISGPVGVGGAQISPVLLTRLVNDVGDNPDQLSILQHALNRTWAYWENEGGGKGPLDLAHYEAIGTMAHALDQHAERAYAELATPGQRQICEKLFKALTDKATDPRGVRRPTTLGTLCALADAAADEVTEVIEVFRKPSRSFLMPPAGEALGAKTTIDISHESLMRVWQRLMAWANDEARSARTYRRLAETAALHAEGQASLWRDPDLQMALDWRDHSQPNETWAARYHPGFPVAMGFLTQSSEARDAERAEVEQRRRGELEVAERLRRFKLALTGVVVLGVVFFLAWSSIQSGRQLRKARVEQASLLSKAAVNAVEQPPTLGVLLAAEATKIVDDIRKQGTAWPVLLGPAARESEMQRLLASDLQARTLIAGQHKYGTAVYLNWGSDAESPAYLYQARFGPQGRLVIVNTNWEAQLWGPLQGAPTEPLRRDFKKADMDVLAAAISPDGRWLATEYKQGKARLWDLQASDRAYYLYHLDNNQGKNEEDREHWVRSVAFSPDGRWLATGGSDHRARLWRLSDVLSGNCADEKHPCHANLVLMHGKDDGKDDIARKIISLAFSSDGNLLATGDSDNRVRVWPIGRLESSRHDPFVPESSASTSAGREDGLEVTALAFGGQKDRPILAAGGQDNKVRVWKTADPKTTPVELGQSASKITALTFSHDGRWLVSASGDAAVRLWNTADLGDGPATPITLRGHDGAVFAIAFSDDGRKLYTASVDSTVRTWNFDEICHGTRVWPLTPTKPGRAQRSTSYGAASRGARTASFWPPWTRWANRCCGTDCSPTAS
jgi:WD40 repeat protein